MIKLEIPEWGCESYEKDDCPFNYDSIWCTCYKRRISDHTGNGVKRPPEWCKASFGMVVELRGKG